MFTFSVTDVRAVVARGRIDAFLNGGFRNPHYGLAPGKDEKPGLWLVGDEGVYILSNGKLAEAREAAAAVEVARVLTESPGQPLPNALLQTDALAKLKAEQEKNLGKAEAERAKFQSAKGQRQT